MAETVCECNYTKIVDICKFSHKKEHYLCHFSVYTRKPNPQSGRICSTIRSVCGIFILFRQSKELSLLDELGLLYVTIGGNGMQNIHTLWKGGYIYIRLIGLKHALTVEVV